MLYCIKICKLGGEGEGGARGIVENHPQGGGYLPKERAPFLASTPQKRYIQGRIYHVWELQQVRVSMQETFCLLVLRLAQDQCYIHQVRLNASDAVKLD